MVVMPYLHRTMRRLNQLRKNEGYHKALKEVQSDIGSLMWDLTQDAP